MSSGILDCIVGIVGSGGGSILAVVLAAFLSIKAVDLTRTMIAKRSGTAAPKLEELRMICPISSGRRTLDDLHDDLIAIAGGIDHLNEKRDEDASATGRLGQAITELRVEIAKRNGTRGV